MADANPTVHRAHWNSRLGFILAAAGSAVGLGNIWRFPYLAGENGGGAFLVLYLAIAFTLGVSVLLAELAIGRLGQRNPVGAMRALAGGPWTAAGYLGTATAFLVLSFYSVVGGWTLAYIVKSATGTLGGESADAAKLVFGALVGGAAEPVIYHGLFMALTAAIVLRGVGGGIEAANKWLMPALFLLLVVLVLRAVTLPGAAKGLAFYLTPDFSMVTPATVVAALSQAFFSLSVGLGAMITYGSYLDRRGGNLSRSAFWITGIDCSVAVLGGLLIFSAVFAFGHDPAAGPGLTFVTLPTVFHQMPGGALFAVAFFLLLALAALTSAVSLLEVAVAYLVDERAMPRRRATLGLGLAVFFAGIPSALSLGPWSSYTLYGRGVMDLLDDLTVKVMIPLGGIVLSLFVGWILADRAAAALAGPARPLWLRAWIAMCRYVAPAAIGWVMVAGLWG